MVRTACKLGSVSLLWPKGTTSIEEVSEVLTRAIDHAIVVNSWHEFYDKEDIPPKWMWPFDEEITDWFDEVKKNRNKPRSEPMEDAPNMVYNELAKDLR